MGVLDLSPLGARLEHQAILTPGQLHLLTFTPPDSTHLRLPSRVVWSRPYRSESERSGTRRVQHSGVEFQDVPPAGGQELLAYLYRVRADVPPSPARSEAPRTG